jgi:hypothetical protein
MAPGYQDFGGAAAMDGTAGVGDTPEVGITVTAVIALTTVVDIIEMAIKLIVVVGAVTTAATEMITAVITRTIVRDIVMAAAAIIVVAVAITWSVAVVGIMAGDITVAGVTVVDTTKSFMAQGQMT